MKLSELREHTREGRWVAPSVMRWQLDHANLCELMKDIDVALAQASEAGYLEGAAQAEAKAAEQREYGPQGKAWFERNENPGELSKIRDRLNYLEVQEKLTLEVLAAVDRDDKLKQVEQRVVRLEQWLDRVTRD